LKVAANPTSAVLSTQGFARELGAPVVLKTSGLAAGKGVLIAPTLEDAYKYIDDMMVNKIFGSAGE
jgi:phosphoribosylamine--glycine ligase